MPTTSDPFAFSTVPTFADPCEIGARFSIHDEDGSSLFEIEIDAHDVQ